MTEQERLDRVKELQDLEIQVKAKRDFDSLISIYNEYIELIDLNYFVSKNLPVIAYCYSRLGKKDEARKTLQKLEPYTVSVDNNYLETAIFIVSFFLNVDATNLTAHQKETLEDMYYNENTSEALCYIVFDIEDILIKNDNMDNNWNTIEKQSVITILLDIVQADGKTETNEILAVSKICKSLNISNEEVALGGLQKTPQAMLNLAKMNENKKIQLGQIMLDVIESDGNIHKNEIIVFNSVFRFMGFDVRLKSE